MSDESRPPEDDWSPDDADDTGRDSGRDPDEGAGPWGWLDDAVDAWDGGSAPEPAPAEDFDADGPGDGDGDGPEAPAPLPDDDREPLPIELALPDDDAHDGADAAAGDDADDAAWAAAFPAGDLAGTCSTAALADALGLAGVDDADVILSALGADQVDARDAVGALDFAGVPARVEHAGLGELLERLEAGDEVVLGGGAPHALVAIDPASGEIVVEPLAGGPRRTVAIAAFEDAWDDSANELMVLSPDNPGISLGTGEVCLVPVAVSDIL